MATKIQPMPRRRRQIAVAAPQQQTATPQPPTLPPPPITQGVDAVVEWFGRLNLHLLGDNAPTGHKLKTLQTVLSSFSRVRSPAREVEMILKARQQREGVSYALAYADEAPVSDAQALPLWHAMEIARLAQLVSASSLVDAEDYRNVSARLKHHVAGVQVREVAETTAFKRRHKIGADVAGAVEGYAAVQAELEKEQLTAGDAERARTDLVAFGHFMKGDFASPWHVQVVCDALMKAERREIKGLIINMPPRRGKSTVASELFPAWYLGLHPSHDIIVATHSQHFADSVGRKIRNAIASPEYQRIFPGIHVASDSSAAAVFEIVVDGASARQRRGNCKSFGRGGAPAGSGSHCFPAGTLISTEVGPIPIEKFCEVGYIPPQVLTYDHRTKQAIYGNVVASAQRRAKGLVEVTTSRGRRIVATPEHLVYTSTGWVQAQALKPGFTLVVEDAQSLSAVRRSQVHVVGAMQSLLHQGGGDLLCTDLLCVQERVFPRESGSREGVSQGIQVHLLLDGLHKRAQQDQADTTEAVSSLRCGVTEGSGVLLSEVRECRPIPAGNEGLRVLQGAVQGGELSTSLLWESVCQQLPCPAYEGTGQLTLQNGDQLCGLVSEHASADSGARRAQMCPVSEGRDLATCHGEGDADDAIGDCHPPHRRRSSVEPPREPDCAVRGVPHLPPQSTEDTVAVVRRYSDEEVVVYDLQVAEHSCFFAGEILVHNCLLIDDFLSEQDAYSSTERSHLIDDLLAFRTRLAPDAIWIVINTRYHEDDVVGIVQRDFADDRQWTVITLPEFAEKPEEWVINTPASKGHPAERRVFRRDVGQVLWPERFSAESSEQLRSALMKAAPQKWWGQFMCRPVADSGAMVDPAWFRRYDYADVMELRQRAVRVVVSTDTGGTKLRQISSASARTAITVWAEMEDGRCYLVDLIAEPWIYPDIIAHVKDACRQWKPTDLLIENKAAGLELIADLSEHRDWSRTPITSITPVGPKETRMAVASPQIRAGLIYLPAATPCADVPSLRCSAPAWLVDFVNEVMHFPHSRYRDISDSTSQMLNWRRENPVQGSGFSTDMTTTGARRDIEAALRGPWGARGGNSGGSVRKVGW